VSEQFMQADLFTPTVDNTKLMNSLDSINKVFGKGTIRLASEQQTKSWEMKRDFLSPRYTTRWNDIPKIQC
jgi:DNA polymerase V